MQDLLNPASLVKDFSYIGIFTAIFLESGIFFGFFLPGDSLLFTAGLLAANHYLNLAGIILVSLAGAILGNNAGYYTGSRFGGRLFNRPGSFWLTPNRINEAHEFFEKTGPRALILARFIPVLRTFMPIAAGAAKMRYRIFFRYNAIGGLLWGISLPALGYSLGKSVPNIDKYLLPVILLIIIVSLLPALRHHLKRRSNSSN